MSVKIKVDFSGIVDAIGDVEGFADALNDPVYMDGLINVAHNTASADFDLDAAATAVPNNMTHVYEFGTPGITRGQPRFPDPTSPAARLWQHTSIGSGRSRTLGFVFRPAVAPNPRPSANFYGVPSSVISKLSRKKYIFRNKASVVEFGETVYIKPKEKPFNFVPFYGKPSTHYPGRTFIFRPIEGRSPMESNPGEDSGMKGTFTNFWTGWWNTRGDMIMSGDVESTIIKDIMWIMERPSTQGTLESPMRFNSRGRIYNRRRKMKSSMMRRAQQRSKWRRT